MSEFEKVIKNVVLGGIGAAATVVEMGGELAKSFVEKGEETIRQNQAACDELKEKVKNACESAKSACENAKMSFDLARMTAEERAELRRQLDAFDAAEAEAAAQDEAAEDAPDEEITPDEPEEVSDDLSEGTEAEYTIDEEN